MSSLLNLDAFESVLKSNSIDLSTLNKANPIKTKEEIKADWLKQRLGKFTASEFHRLMTYPNKDDLPAGAISYVMEKVAECLIEQDITEGFTSYDMQWGIDNEAGAVQAFTEKTGLPVDKYSIEQEFITLGEHIGCTPDGLGLIKNTMGIEIKCPKSVTHIAYWSIKTGDDLKRDCPNYYWQVQGSMFITDRPHWYFVSFDPRFKNPAHRLHLVRIDCNKSDIAALYNRLMQAIILKINTLKQFNQGIYHA